MFRRSPIPCESVLYRYHRFKITEKSDGSICLVYVFVKIVRPKVDGKRCCYSLPPYKREYNISEKHGCQSSRISKFQYVISR